MFQMAQGIPNFSFYKVVMFFLFSPKFYGISKLLERNVTDHRLKTTFGSALENIQC